MASVPQHNTYIIVSGDYECHWDLQQAILKGDFTTTSDAHFVFGFKDDYMSETGGEIYDDFESLWSSS